MAERSLAKAYSPREHEPECLDRWTLERCFHAEPGDPGAPYSVFIPPPNVTAALHLGHALNNTLQDVLMRVARMRGANAMWMPGTDHAGIATQAVVERRLLQQGIRRTDLSREAFVAKVQEWKDEYEAVILDQLRAMGASCDYERVRFTMDPVCTAAVREAFFRLFSDGLIYRGKRLVNWDPVSQTALADDEVEMEELDGHFWYLRYPLEDGSGHITVATTRPETMLGDTGVAVNPKDPRAAALRGKSVRLPIVGRVIPVVEDDYVVMPVSLGGDPADPKAQFASGFLKVTPAHDANDWEIGVRHGLAAINVMAPDASISDRHGWTDVSADARAFVGMSRESARAAIVDWFRANGLLEDAKPYRHSVGHSYRSHVPVEPYLSDQWYVRVTDDRLRGAALRAMAPEQVDGALPASFVATTAREGDGGLRFFPPRYARTFQQWHEGIRDWCISRQLWWGHRIPVWSRVVTVDAQGSDLSASASSAIDAAIAASAASGLAIRANRISDGAAVDCARGMDAALRAAGPGEYAIHACARDDPAGAALEAHGFARDPDVLDTWFSSALWPMSTLGWPEPGRFGMDRLLDTWNPSAVLSTAREIITLWVSRMVMMNRYLLGGRVPFRHVFIHSIVQDGYGQKMSKSLGNGVDPRDIIATHGADALRFCLVQMSTGTQDVRLPVDVLCPFTGEAFTPRTVTTPSGHTVAAPIQSCPKDPARKMVTAFGASSGQVTPTDEMPLARNTSARFDIGRNFANKMWNATRFALAQFPEGGDPADGAVRPERLVDRWMLATFARAVRAVDESVDGYQFNACAETLYNLVWRDFCDWYLEAVKPTVKSDAVQRAVLRAVLNGSMRLMHPVMPFVTEALWPWVQGIAGTPVSGVPLEPSAMLARAVWPAVDASLDDEDAIARFSQVQSLVLAIRNVRGERGVEVKRRITLHAPEATSAIVRDGAGVVETLAGLSAVVALDPAVRPADAVPVAFEGEEFWLSGLVDAIDSAAERQRLAKTIADRERIAAGYRAKLSNPGYLAKAKPELVEETRTLLTKAEADIAAARKASDALSGA